MSDQQSPTTRRRFLQTAATGMGAIAALGATPDLEAQQVPNARNKVQLSQIHNTATDEAEKAPGPFLPPGRRVGYAIVGLGRLSIDQILPAFATSKYCKPVAFVSGHRDKALRLAAQYGIPESNITDYNNYERLRDMPGVEAIYIVLPNSMHKEFTVRGAKIGKHILCEKPMATSAADCEAMIDACKHANVRLMIAYRQQYEPMNRFLQDSVRNGKLGRIRSVVASNSQNEGDPTQWRLKKSLAGGGCLPDVGVYCLNATRFLTGEEPEEVTAMTVQPKDDPRFAEVESRCSFVLRFPSGMIATLTTAYDVHHSSFLRMEGTDGTAEMDPAFGYHGARLRFMKLGDANSFGNPGPAETQPPTTLPNGTPNTSSAPNAAAPDIRASSTSVPNASVPYTSVPNTPAPGASAPSAYGPSASAPNGSAPSASVPNASVPAPLFRPTNASGGTQNKDVTFTPDLPDKDQFALEMDHFSQCVLNNTQPRTPGEEGLQDQRIMDAIYKSASTNRPVRIPQPITPTRGPVPTQSN